MEKINTLRIRFVLFLSVFLCFSQVIYAQSPLAPGGTDYEVLKALYEATDGDNWRNNTGWDFSGNVSVTNDWYGITVESGRIVGVYLYNEQLTGAIPSELGNLTNLENLLLSNNQLTSLPPEIGNLTNLKQLRLDDNQFTSLPPEIGNLTNLTRLEFHNNQLTSLPSEIGNLTNLTRLPLYNNQLTSLPPEIGNLTNLGVLELYNNQLTSLPSKIGNLTNVWTLELYNNQLTSLPPEIGNLTKLTRLPLYNNQLTSLPPEIGNLTNLTSLSLYNNQLTSLPPEIGNLTNLWTLDLDNNQLTALPPEIGNLTKLTRLDLHNNQLTSLPPEIGNLTLGWLALDNNQLTSLPPEIGNLTLWRLDLDSNQLTDLPTELNFRHDSSFISLQNNRFTVIPFVLSKIRVGSIDISNNPQLSGVIPIDFINLNSLFQFYYENTNLCEPQTIEFKNWLDGISWVRNEGILPCMESNLLTGRIYNAVTSQGLSNYYVEVYPGGYYGQSDENGFYTVSMPEGNYTALVKPTYPELVQKLPEDYVFEFVGVENRMTKNFAVEILNKPLIKTDLGSTRRRRCFDATTNLTYENVGFANATNSKLTVTYPEFVNPISSSPPWSSRNGKVLTWNLNTISEGEKGKIYIQDSVICWQEEIRGLTQCTEIVASYDNRRISENPLWDKSNIKLSAFCHSGNVKLTIQNQGEGNMNEVRKYRLFLDAEFHTEGDFQLTTGEEKIIEITPNGKTVRLEAAQSFYHPEKSQPSITQEACGIGELSSSNQNFFAISKGKVNELPMDDADEFREIDCMEITDSYDPNDKTAYPKGVTDKNYITDNQELEYRVRFQNTGTDTAYQIVVHDSLPEQVDISTLRMGASSHDYTWELKRNENNGKMALICTFKDIYLPDDKIDETGSHGFFKFKIRQKANNPKGTNIQNQAFIYFDFNSAIITNKTSNIVWDLPLMEPKFRVNQGGNRTETGKNNSTTFDNVSVLVCGMDFPTLAQIDEKIELCYDTESIILKGNLPKKGTGSWKMIDGSGEILPISSTEIEVKNLGFGKHLFEWQISLCDSASKSQIEVYRKQPIETKIKGEKREVCYNHEIVKFQDAGPAKNWKLISGAGKISQVSEDEIGIENLAEGSNIFQKIIGSCDSITTTEVEIFRNGNLDFKVENEGDTLKTIKADSYQWFWNGTKIDTATTPNYFATEHGDYSVEIEKEGCVYRSSVLGHRLTALESKLDVSNFRLYPNPVKNTLNLEFSSLQMGEISVKILNILGQEKEVFLAEKTEQNFQKTISLTQLSKGIYYLQVQVDNRITVWKFVKL